MNPGRYRKRPVVVEAFQWQGQGLDDCPEWFRKAVSEGWCWIQRDSSGSVVHIRTLEGEITGKETDWLVKGFIGEVYPCKPAIFEQTYEEVSDGEDR